MEELLQQIEEKLQSVHSLNWLIVHDLSKISIDIGEVKFSFVDAKENIYEPFKMSLGYLTLETIAAYELFKNQLVNWLKHYKNNLSALSQLYILTSRICYPSGQAPLTDLFKSTLTRKQTALLYFNLITVLNAFYFKHLHHSFKQTESVEDWLTLIQSAQYRHHIADPLMSVLYLVKPPGHHLSYQLIKEMSPMLRAPLIGWYGYQIIFKSKELQLVYDNPGERMFLAAVLLESRGVTEPLPPWLKYTLMEKFLDADWEKIGQYLFAQVYGLNFRKRQENAVYRMMQKLIQKFIKAKLINNSVAALWISKLEFPKHFIAISACFTDDRSIFGKLSDGTLSLLLDQFLSELKKISQQIPKLMAETNSSDPFMTAYIGEDKYLATLAYALILLLYADDEQFKLLKKVCFDFKPLFYGGFRAKYLATHFSETMLLLALSGHHLNKLPKDSGPTFDKLLQIISDTILVPFIHLTEREEDIWNPDYEFGTSLTNVGRQQINVFLKAISTHAVKPYYQSLLNLLDATKSARWPYERV